MLIIIIINLCVHAVSQVKNNHAHNPITSSFQENGKSKEKLFD